LLQPIRERSNTMATYPTTLTPLSMIAASPMTSTTSSTNNAPGSWFEAMAAAWGNVLDQQAAVIQQDSAALTNGGGDSPSAITTLSAESLKMSFLSDNSHTSLTSVGEALDTVARKQ
jgi:hypothetical protein